MEARTMNATMPRIIDYGQCTDDMHAKVTVLESRQIGRNEYKLIHSTAGYEAAGAAMRWTDEYYAVRWFDNALNAMYGKRFSTLAPAKQYLDSRQ